MKDCNGILSLSPILPGSRAPSMSHSFLEVCLIQNRKMGVWRGSCHVVLRIFVHIRVRPGTACLFEPCKSNGTILVRRIYAGFTPRAVGGRALQYSLTNSCLLYINLFVIFLVSPDFRSDIFSAVRQKFGSEISNVSGPFLFGHIGKLSRHVGVGLGQESLLLAF